MWPFPKRVSAPIISTARAGECLCVPVPAMAITSEAYSPEISQANLRNAKLTTVEIITAQKSPSQTVSIVLLYSTAPPADSLPLCAQRTSTRMRTAAAEMPLSLAEAHRPGTRFPSPSPCRWISATQHLSSSSTLVPSSHLHRPALQLYNPSRGQ